MLVTTESFSQLIHEATSEAMFLTMAESFKILADPTRLKILALLFTETLSVGEIAEHLVVSQSAVSHQLRLLRNLNIVRYRKQGREVHYDLADDHVRDILQRTFEHILHD